MNGKYHLIFNDDSFTDSDNEVIDRLYKDLFEFEAIDICKLSDIADSWNGKISNSKDFIELFFNELPTWGLPLRRLELPKRQEIMGRKNVLAGCHRFIVRQPFNSKMSITQYNKYMKRRRSSHKNHMKGPRKRTEDDDVRFAQSFEKLILMAKSKEGAQSGTI